MPEDELRATSDLALIAEWSDNLFFQVTDQREVLLRNQDKRMLFSDFEELLKARILPSATATGTNTYVATLTPAITALSPTLRLFVRFTNANTGPATLNLNGLGAKPIVKNVSTALATGDILAGQVLCLAYDGTSFQIVGSNSTGGGGGGATNLDALTDVVLTNPATGQVLKFNGTSWVNDTDATGGGGTIDTVPTDGSTNAVSSNGVFDALATKADAVTLATLEDDQETLKIYKSTNFNGF